MRSARRAAILAAGVLGLTSLSQGYYHWTYFANRSDASHPILAKFDLNALPGKTISYFISEQGPGPLMPGDSVTAILSQIRLAGEAWDSVSTSAIRLKFGGYGTAAAQTTPGIDVVFDDEMPPGVLAQTYVVRPQDLGFLQASSTTFVPIWRSRVQIRKDLTAKQQVSYSEKFFTTLVHEFGHALGLQHTLTSSAMSTNVTRATTKARPLTQDDIAGLSELYPSDDFAAATGSISGRVTADGQGINLASVVAIATDGTAVSGMTNPDGTYKILGVPPGEYRVYVHPLPPAIVAQGETSPAAIIAPVDGQNQSFPADTGFLTQFFPGTQDFTQAAAVPVGTQNETGGVDFHVQRSGGPALANMQTYGFLGPNSDIAVPAPSLPGGKRAYLVFYADGALTNGALTPGLTVNTAGGPAFIEPGSVRFYAPNFVLCIVNASAVTAATPVSLAVTANNDLYVLPAAFVVVPSGAPVVTGASGSPDGNGGAIVTVTGSNLNASTRVLFDGAPGKVQEVHDDGSLVVAAPPASGAYQASVVALSADGQTSAQALGPTAPVSFTYASPDNLVLSVNPAYVTAGTDAMIEIKGFQTGFLDGLVSVGFGSSDLLVRRVWVTGPDRLLLNLTVNAGATPGSTTITVMNGLQVVTLKGIFQVQQAAKVLTLRAPVVSQETGFAGVVAGRVAIINTAGLPSNPASWTGWTLTIGGAQASFRLGDTQMLALVPASVPPGPTVVRLTPATGETVPPILMQVDGAPPVIGSVTVGGQAVTDATPAHVGDTVTVGVTQLAEPDGSIPAASRVRILVAGIEHTASAVTPQDGGGYAVSFVLSARVPEGSQQSLLLGVGTRFSLPAVMAVTQAQANAQKR